VLVLVLDWPVCVEIELVPLEPLELLDELLVVELPELELFVVVLLTVDRCVWMKAP
jgi:hypothetical protein